MTKKVIKGLKNKMKNKRFQRKVFSFITMVLFMVLVIGLTATPALAEEYDPANDKGLESLDLIIDWIATWAGRIGLVVAFFGALQTALGFMNDDADSKVRGLKLLAAGFMIWGISGSYDYFFSPN
ncbi:MAG: hypothetical protein ACOYED_03135 [Peptococcia bacterium]|jgi:hypothetical protein